MRVKNGDHEQDRHMMEPDGTSSQTKRRHTFLPDVIDQDGLRPLDGRHLEGMITGKNVFDPDAHVGIQLGQPAEESAPICPSALDQSAFQSTIIFGSRHAVMKQRQHHPEPEHSSSHNNKLWRQLVESSTSLSKGLQFTSKTQAACRLSATRSQY